MNLTKSSGGTLLDDVDLKVLVKRRHPDYESKIDHWKFAELCFRGGRAWFNTEEDDDKKNLFPFYKEGKEEYLGRARRAHRANHTKRVVETINQYLFRQKPGRSANTDATLKKFWERVDGKKKHIDKFMNEVEAWASVLGRPYVCVDRPAQIANTKAEEKLPYAYIILPQHILDFGFDEDGNYSWILVCEDQRDQTLDGDGQIKEQYRLWTKFEWFVIKETDPLNANGEKEFTVFEKGEHGLEMVPIIPVDDGDENKYSAKGVCDDIVYMDRAVVNYGSLLDEILYEQTFSQLAVPDEAMPAGAGTSKGNNTAMVAAAKNRIFTYNSIAPGMKPEFISPDASQAELLLKAIDQLRREIYSVTGTDNNASSQSMSKGKEYASGKVMEFDHTQIENILLDKARALETSEDKIAELVLKWMNKKVEIQKDWVRYPEKFDIRGLVAELDVAASMGEVEAPDEIMREQMKLVADKAFPRMSEADRTKMVAIIDAWIPKHTFERKMKEQETNAKTTVAEASMQAAEASEISADASTVSAEASMVTAKKPTPKPVKPSK